MHSFAVTGPGKNENADFLRCRPGGGGSSRGHIAFVGEEVLAVICLYPSRSAASSFALECLYATSSWLSGAGVCSAIAGLV
jgi:hypothetical protein